jgi:CBS-domain-containing membrane protein
MKQIKDLMTNHTASSNRNENIDGLSEKMRAYGLNSLVVLDDEKVVVGTLSYLDVCIAPLRLQKTSSEIKVVDVMSANTFTINIHDDETLALNLMRQFHMNSLPVVDNENKLRGIVRFITLARRIISFKKKFKMPSVPTFHSELA